MRLELINLSDIRAALNEATKGLPEIAAIRECLERLDEIVHPLRTLCNHDSILLWLCQVYISQIVAHQPGDLVECQNAAGEWEPSVVIAHMICMVRYVCGAGDDRNAAKAAGVFAYSPNLIRSRETPAEGGAA